jgi:hypothetical protein
MRRTIPFAGPTFAAAVAAAALLIASTDNRTNSLLLAQSDRRTNFSRIEDGLYLGGRIEEPPPGTRAVLNVCTYRDPYKAEFHRWDPIVDAPPGPGVDWLRQQVAFIDEQRRAGRTVYVHCSAGISRGPTVMAAYLMWRDGVSRDRALEVLRKQRPVVEPNATFMRLLAEWEKTVKKPNR